MHLWNLLGGGVSSESSRVPFNEQDQPDQYLNGSKFLFSGLVGSDAKVVKSRKDFFDTAYEGASLSFVYGLKLYRKGKPLTSNAHVID